jgi:hypothetical protein
MGCTLLDGCHRRTVPLENRRKLSDARPVSLQAARRHAGWFHDPDIAIGALNIGNRLVGEDADGDGDGGGDSENRQI